jgi:hypothetical protein
MYEGLTYGYFSKQNLVSLINIFYHVFTHILCVDIFVKFLLGTQYPL